MSAGISSSSCGRTSERGMNPGQAACPTARGPHLEAGGISLPGSPSPTHPGQVPRSAPLSTGGSAPIPQCFLPPSLRQTLTLGRPPSPVQVLFPRRCPERPSVCWPQKSRGRSSPEGAGSVFHGDDHTGWSFHTDALYWSEKTLPESQLSGSFCHKGVSSSVRCHFLHLLRSSGVFCSILRGGEWLPLILNNQASSPSWLCPLVTV